MAGLAARIAATSSGLWLDHTDYSGRLLAGGRIPWLDLAALLAYHRAAHGLLDPAVGIVPLEAFFAAWLDAHAELAAEMGGKRRVGGPLRVLLAAEGPRAAVAETVRAVRTACGAVPLVLTLPSPRRWLVWAAARVGGSGEPAGDDVETAAAHVADFLRVLAGAGVDGLLLEESPGGGPASREGLAWYRPVANLAEHYRWDLGLAAPGCAVVPAPGDGFDFCLAAGAGIACGVPLGESFWAGAAAPPLRAGDFWFARVPPGAVPEQVLERLAAHRCARG